MALNILSSGKEEKDENLRQWAVEIINKYSDVPLSDSLQKKISQSKVNFGGTGPPSGGTGPNTEVAVAGSLVKELQKRNTLELVCNTNNIVNSTMRYEDGRYCSNRYRGIIEDIPVRYFTFSEKEIIRKADSIFNNQQYVNSAMEYKKLFIKYCSK